MSEIPPHLREPNEHWIQRWRDNNIGWHHVEFNAHLLNHWHHLALPSGSLVLAPLCGKSRDMIWLAEQGYRIRGVELSRIAVETFFEEHALTPEVTPAGAFERWSSGPFELYCGDIFDLQELPLQDLDAVYDRASLVALNPSQRKQFSQMLMDNLPEGIKILLVTMSYPQNEMAGPPYSVPQEEVRELFDSRFEIRLLHTLDLLKDSQRYGDRGVSRMLEEIYLLS
ncbi:MAG: thiopurine S-methyltransferase [Candidatus Thiodiazotropha sp.]